MYVHIPGTTCYCGYLRYLCPLGINAYGMLADQKSRCCFARLPACVIAQPPAKIQLLPIESPAFRVRQSSVIPGVPVFGIPVGCGSTGVARPWTADGEVGAGVRYADFFEAIPPMSW